MEHLLDIINIRKSELMNIEIDTTDINYLNNYNIDIDSLTKYSFKDLLILFYMSESKSSYLEALQEIETVHDVFNELLQKDNESILKLLCTFEAVPEKHKRSLTTYNSIKSIKSLNPAIIGIKTLLKALKKINTIENVNKLIMWVTDKKYKKILEVSSHLIILKKHLDNIEENIKSEIDYPFIPDKEKRRATKKFSKELKNEYLNKINSLIKNELENLRDYKKTKNSEVKTETKRIKKQLEALETLENDIRTNSLNINKIKKYNLESDLLHIVLIELIKQNNEKYNKTYLEVINLSTNSIEQLFHQYKIDYNQLTEEEKQIISTLDKSKLTEALNLITNGNFNLNTFDEAFVNVISLPIETLKILDILLIRKKITPDFILRYGKKFNQSNVLLMDEIINKLTTLGVDFIVLQNYNDEILMNANIKLLELLEKYEINLQNEKLVYFELLEEPKLLSTIDKYIELGFDQIKENADLINDQSNITLKRIMILDKMGINYLESHNDLNQNIYYSNDFYISDNMLDEYTYTNSQIYINENYFNTLNASENLEVLETIPEELSFIEEYKKNEQVYIINGNYFSRIKVLRCLKTLIDAGFNDYQEMLFASLIYNYPKYLSIDEIEKLKYINKNTNIKQLV